MTLILIKNKNAAALPYLFRLVLRYIYEKDKMRLEEIHLMQESMINWANKYDLDEDEQYIIERLAMMLKKEEEGKYEKRKKLFQEKGISWQRFHKLPEAYDLKTLIKAQQDVKEYERTNPNTE